MADQDPVIVADPAAGEPEGAGSPAPAPAQQPPEQPPQQPPSQSQPQPQSQPAKKQRSSPSVAANVDAFLTRLNRCMSTPAGTDAILMFVGYSARLAAELLDTAGRSAIHATAHRLITLAFSLPPRTAVLLSANPAAARASPLASAALKLATRLRALAALLSEGRVFMRSWALLSMYVWGRSLVQSLKGKDNDEKKKASSSGRTLDNTIACTQFAALLVFQALENVYFLGSKGVLPVSPPKQVKALRWGTRAWAVYVGVELGRLFVEHRRKKSAGDVDVSSEEHKAWRDNWQRSVVRNLAWAPLTVHWSLEKGFLNDLTTWSIAYIPAVIAGRNAWRESA